MEIIDFKNNKEPGISEETLIQLQTNIEKAIKEQVQIKTLFANGDGLTSGNLNDNVDNYDLVVVIVANKGNTTENQFLLFPVMSGTLNNMWYTQSYNIRGTSSYYCSGKVYLNQKTSFTVDMSTPVGWVNGDVRIYKIIGIKF